MLRHKLVRLVLNQRDWVALRVERFRRAGELGAPKAVSRLGGVSSGFRTRRPNIQGRLNVHGNGQAVKNSKFLFIAANKWVPWGGNELLWGLAMENLAGRGKEIRVSVLSLT
jgi:hypothetical protein